MDSKDEGVEKIVEHIENEKKRVHKEFDDLYSHVTSIMNKKRDEAIYSLEQQLFIYRNNYTYFEKQVKKAFPSQEDYEMMYPTKQALEERFGKISNSIQLQAFVKNIKQDINEHALMGGLQDADEELKRLMFLKRLGENLEKNKKNYPSMISSTCDVPALKERISKAIQDATNSLFALENSYTDLSLSGGILFPMNSKILKSEDFKKIQAFLDPKYQSKSWKLIYSYAQDGKGTATLNKKLEGKAPTVIVYKNHTYGKIFGGFMDKVWNSVNSGGYFQSLEAFLFSVNNNKKYLPVTSSGNHGYWDSVTYGPCFGGDLYVDGNGTGYSNPSAYTGFTAYDLAGNSSWTAEEYEIYQLQ